MPPTQWRDFTDHGGFRVRFGERRNRHTYEIWRDGADGPTESCRGFYSYSSARSAAMDALERLKAKRGAA